jgi:hypothetical protein
MTDNIVYLPIIPAPTAYAAADARAIAQNLTVLTIAADARVRAKSAARWDRERGSQPLAMLHFDLAGPGLDYVAAQAPRLFWIGLAAAVMAAGLIQAGVWG